MRRLAGQAALRVWVTMHRLLTLALAILVLGAAALGLFAWRLSQGPLELAWLARQVEAAVNTADGPRLTIDGAALAWEGFRAGVDRPLDIRLRGIAASTPAGEPVFAIPAAEISLSLRALLLGRFEPRGVALHGAQLTAHRAADGALSIDLGQRPTPVDPAAEDAPGLVNALLAELARPAATDRAEFRETRLSQLRRLVIDEAELTVVDRQLGTTWRAPRVDIDLRRRPAGGIDGAADIALAIGPEQARLRLEVALAEGVESGKAKASLTQIAPAALAPLSPMLAPLAMLDARVALDGQLELGPALALREGVLRARIGAGTLNLGGAPVLLRGADAAIALTADTASLRQLRLDIAPGADAPSSIVTAAGTLTQRDGRWHGSGRIGLDRADFADLPILWPTGLAPNAREWIVQNMTAGTARDAALDIALSANADFSGVEVTEVKGGLTGEDITVHWLRPVPPLERVRARLAVSDPDRLDITTEGGQLRLENARGDPSGALTARSGRVRISGLTQYNQVAQIDLGIAAPVPDVIALLRHPRLRLLDRSPFELRQPAGSLTGQLAVSVPLDYSVALEDLAIRATARTDGVRLAGIVAGRDLEQGALELEATTDMLKVGGQATVGGIAGQLAVELDFRAGGPAQIQQRISASAKADIQKLAAIADLDAGPLAAGPAAAQLAYTRRRDGTAELRLSGDLRETALRFAPLAWRKPPGQPASLEMRLRLARDRVVGIDDIALNGEALVLRGRLEQTEGRLALLRLDRAVLGRTQGRGTVVFQPDGRIRADVEGTSLDLGPRLTAPPSPQPAPSMGNAAPERPWTVNARFSEAFLAHDVRASGFRFHAESDGLAIQRLRLDGVVGTGPFHMQIAPDRGVRRLNAAAADAGTLLRGLDIAKKFDGGTLKMEGQYDDRAADRPLIGTATIENFRVLDAPAVTALLQAMTLYGLVQMAQGPGLGMTRLEAPFRMNDVMLELQDARAFNASLGITVKGRIDRVRETCDLSGTIVPAYFFNSLLGDVPLIGRLFAPEAGGGLFAASYTVTGPLAKPQVSVNPLSALTPGFLRKLFGIF